MRSRRSSPSAPRLSVAEIAALDADAARRRLVERADQVEHRRLARARRAAQRRELAALDGQATPRSAGTSTSPWR